METERLFGNQAPYPQQHKEDPEYMTPPSRIRRGLRWIGWNVLWLSVGLMSVVGSVEVYLRVTTPFMSSSNPTRFLPKVGLILNRNAEVRSTHQLDYWTISRTNSFGFLDREPPNPEWAMASCHITMIGDSFVEARHVPIAEKFHVQLEALASRHLPRLNITTSAFGYIGTSQIAQLPYYDEFARHLHPKLLVLVFVPNDFSGNSPTLTALTQGFDPHHSPFTTVAKDENGIMTVRPPSPDFRTFRFQLYDYPWFVPVKDWLVQKFYFVAWMKTMMFQERLKRLLLGIDKSGSLPLNRSYITAKAELLRRHPDYATRLDGWNPTTQGHLDITAYEKKLPFVLEEAVEFTAFALDRFKDRAVRDGAALVILSIHRMGTRGHPLYDRLSALADARGIPVIDQHGYILRQRDDPAEANWAHDGHWNPTGHRWAAEALLEYLKQHPEICDGAAAR